MGEADPLMDVVWILLMAAGLGVMGWYAFRAEPHWVAKDGKAFTCRLQQLGTHGIPDGRWREARAFIEGEHVIVRPRGGLRSGKPSAHYLVIKRAEDPPPGKCTFLVDGEGVNGHDFAVLRVPARSRAVTAIAALIASP